MSYRDWRLITLKNMGFYTLKMQVFDFLWFFIRNFFPAKSDPIFYIIKVYSFVNFVPGTKLMLAQPKVKAHNL